MPQPAKDSLRPLTGFNFAPPTASTGADTSNERQPAEGTSSGGGVDRRGKNAEATGTTRPDVRAVLESGTSRTSGQAASMKPLSAFAPAPTPRSLPPKPKTKVAPPKNLNPIAAPPPRPAPASSTSNKPPPQKRQKRVLATEEELTGWTVEENGRDRKGKGRAAAAEEVEERETNMEERAADPPKRDPPRTAASYSAKPAHRSLAALSEVFSPAPKARIPGATKASTPARDSPAQHLHRLSSFSPFPSAATPDKPKAPLPSQATPVTRLFGQFPTSVKRDEDEKKPFEGRSILAMAPAAPPQADGGDELDLTQESVQGSPGKKGKKGGYLISGIASRASTLFNAAKTEQTLWLHDLSRTLGSVAQPAPIPTLLKLAPPALRLTVLSVVSPDSPDGADTTMRGGRKTLLARCRLELDPLSSPSPPAPGSSPPPRPPRALTGLVLFSLHSYPSSSSLPPPSPIKPRNPSVGGKDDGRRYLYIPTNPHDLHRLVERPFQQPPPGGAAGEGAEKGVEVWVYEPFYPVDLLPEQGIGARSPFFAAPAEPEVRSERVDEEEGAEGVEWDEDVERKRAEEARRAKEAESRKKALVVGRFAVLS